MSSRSGVIKHRVCRKMNANSALPSAPIVWKEERIDTIKSKRRKESKTFSLSVISVTTSSDSFVILSRVTVFSLGWKWNESVMKSPCQKSSIERSAIGTSPLALQLKNFRQWNAHNVSFFSPLFCLSSPFPRFFSSALVDFPVAGQWRQRKYPIHLLAKSA